MPDTIACTIVARNYLHYARTWARSLRAIGDRLDVVVLVVDAEPGDEYETADCRFLTLQDLALEGVRQLAFRYSVLEFCTAVKPSLVRHLLQSGNAERVLYFDPDILVLSSLEPVLRAFGGASILLTPHAMSPLPRDGRQPSDETLLVAGSYNLGFVGVRRSTAATRFLEWWAAHLSNGAYSAPERGLFTDQKWIDLAPSYFDGVAIAKERTFNVAYWNLHERLDVSDAGGSLRVGGAPLVFFHFSGFDPGDPESVSRYQTRYRLSELPGELKMLFLDYADRLRRASSERVPASYAFDFFSDGERIAPIYRRLLESARDEGRVWSDPFAVGDGSFREWATRPRRSGWLPPLAEFIYKNRVDVQGVYPGGYDSNNRAVLRWLIEHDGRPVYGLGESTMEALSCLVAENEPTDALESGRAGTGPEETAGIRVTDRTVNVVGYLDTESGVGEVARSFARALRAAGWDVCAVNVPQERLRRADRSLQGTVTRGAHRRSVVFANADQLPDLVRRHPDWLRRENVVGYWFWEAEPFPRAFDAAYGLVREVWTGSSFCQRVIAERSTVPTVLIPPPIAGPSGLPERRSFGISGGDLVVVSVMDCTSGVRRKNPGGVVSAFRAAFPESGRELLVLKLVGAQPRVVRALSRLAGRSRVRIVNEYWERSKVLDLIAASDVMVSLHRGEGLGLTQLEGMACGIPVVGTEAGGSLDFLKEGACVRIPSTARVAGRAQGPYPAETIWAEPSVAVAADALKRLAHDASWRTHIGERGREVASRFGARSVEIAAHRLSRI